MVSTGLTYIVPGAFDDMKNLQILDLSFNAFSRLSNETFSAETRRRLVQFDISQNRFDCDRDQLWLAEWQVSSPSVFENNIDQNYSCYDFAIHQHRDLLNFTCENFQMVSTGLTYIVPGAFDDMKNLQILDLSFNAFSRLSNETFSAETRRRLVQFDISQNSYATQ
ncbi:uncharacterized protein [Littorina saxatilis]|uniref:uncharacterized protein n=1 Tax=Littorina saxatilis TaxID=31220 RepID=UPI0038B51CF6